MQPVKKLPPKWLRITVLCAISFLALAILIVAFADDPNKKAAPTVVEKKIEKQPFADLIAAIKADSAYTVKAVKVDGGMLYVAAADIENGSEAGAAWYFLNTYELNQNRAISKCLVYKWHKRDKEDSIFTKWEPSGENIPDWRSEEIKSNWSEKYLSKYDGSCDPVTKYLLANLNDADSYEHVETRCIYQQPKDNFKIICTYRAKNAFGGVILSHLVAIVSEEGDIISAKNLD